MSRYTAKSDPNDGVIISYHPDYPTARAGTGTKAVNDLGPNLVGAGQWFNVGNYWLRQAFLRYTHPLVPATEMVTNAALVLEGLQSVPTGDAWSLQVREYDFAETVSDSDWVPGADITSVAPNRLCEWYSIRSVRPLPDQFRTGGRELIDTLNAATGPLNTMWHSSKLLVGRPPTGNFNEYVHFGTNEGGANYFRPRLDFQTTTRSSLTRVEGASAQLSDGSHVYLDADVDGSLILRHNPSGNTYNSVGSVPVSGDAFYDMADGAQAFALVVDPQDNIYVVGKSLIGHNNIRAEAYIKGTGYSWTRQLSEFGAMPFYDGEINQVTATYHSIGTGYIAVCVGHRQGQELQGQVSAAVLSAGALRASSGTLITDSANLPVQWYGGTHNPTGNGMDILALRPDVGVIASHCHDTQPGEATGTIRLYGYYIGSNGTFAADPSTSASNTNLTYLTSVPADGDTRIKLMPIGTSRFCLFGCGRVYSYSNFDNFTRTAISAQVTALGLAGMANDRVQAWDSIYDEATGLVWLYYLDQANSRRLLRTSYSPTTNLWSETEVEVGTNLGTSGSSHVSIRLPRGRVDERRVLVHLGNRSGAGVLSTLIRADTGLNQPPNAPILDAQPTFSAVLARRFSWTGSDPNPRDVQSAFEVEIRDQSSGANVYVSGKTFTAATSFTLAAGTLSNNETYEWRVRVFDSVDAASPWSAYRAFNTTTAGTAEIVNPAEDNPPGLNSSSLLVEWTFTGTAPQAKFRVRVVPTSTNGALFDTGYVEGPQVTSFVITGLVSDVEQRVEVLIEDTDENVSNTATRLITPSFNNPDPPMIVVQATLDGEAIQIGVVNPVPTGDFPAPDFNEVFRSLSGRDEFIKVGETGVSDSFTDYTAAADTLYDYKAVAVAEGRTESDVVTGVSIVFNGLYLHNPLDPGGTVRHFRFGGSVNSDDVGVSGTAIQFVGRAYPVFEYGDLQSQTLELSIKVLFGDDYALSLEYLRDVVRSRSVWCFRDGRGRKIFGVANEVGIADERWGSMVSLSITRVDYDEGFDA